MQWYCLPVEAAVSPHKYALHTHTHAHTHTHTVILAFIDT